MITQNSEVYNPPTYLFSLYTYMEKDLCRGLYTSLFCVIIPTLFPYFLRFWYPYILLHFKCFLLLVIILNAAGDSAQRHHFSLLRMGSRGTFALCTASSRCTRIAGPRAAMSFFLGQISLTNRNKYVHVHVHGGVY